MIKIIINIILIAILFSGCISSMQNIDPKQTKNFENSIKSMDEKDRQSLMSKLVPYLIDFENNRGQ